MLTLNNLKDLRIRHNMKRPVLASLTGIDPAWLRQIELRQAEPWFDEALYLSRCLLTNIATLCGESLRGESPYLLPNPHDLDRWWAGRRLTLSTAVRVARQFGIDDPSLLAATAQTQQIWDVIGSGERTGGICPWCQAKAVPANPVGSSDIIHSPLCLPNNLWASRDRPSAVVDLLPEKRSGRPTGIRAHNLKEPRLLAGLKQHDVAALLGIKSPNYYARIERAEVPLMLTHARVLAHRYGVSVESLYAPPLSVGAPA